MSSSSEFITTLYIFASFLIGFLSLIPTIWCLFHNQSAPGILGLWITLANLIHAINSTIWRNDVVNRAPLWCDLTSKIFLVYSTGSLCCCLCMAKFLSYALTPNAPNLTHAIKNRMNIRNYIFCLGFPILMIPFSFIYSPHRFSMVKTMGCEASYTITWPAFFFFIIWGPIFGLIAAAYTTHVAFRLWQNRRMILVSQPHSQHGSKVPLRRLAALCMTYTTVAFPLAIYYAYLLIRNGGYRPYRPQNFHSNTHSIAYDPDRRSPEFNDSLAIFGGLVFVGFFTFSKEMRIIYHQQFWILRAHTGFLIQNLQSRFNTSSNTYHPRQSDIELNRISPRHHIKMVSPDLSQSTCLSNDLTIRSSEFSHTFKNQFSQPQSDLIYPKPSYFSTLRSLQEHQPSSSQAQTSFDQ